MGRAATLQSLFETAMSDFTEQLHHNECFPLVFLEAMQCGVACISTDEAAVPEIIDDGRTGFIVPKRI